MMLLISEVWLSEGGVSTVIESEGFDIIEKLIPGVM